MGRSGPSELLLQRRQGAAKLRMRTDERIDQLGGPLSPLKQKFTGSTPPHPVASASVSTRPGKDGFINLVAGNGLRNWSGDPKYWSIRNGVLTGKADGTLKMNRFITWKGSTIRNFELRAKVRVTAGGNSGIQYRGSSRPEIGLDIVSGYQCDVVANVPKYNGMLYEERGRRILSQTGEKVIIDPKGRSWVVEKMDLKEFKPDEWHDFRVLVKGNHHQHWIDGHKTADLLDFDPKGRSLEGVLAVQVHVGPAMKIEYKDFRLKNLPDDIALEEFKNHPIPDDAFGVRPQGRLPKDWKPPIYGKVKNK